MCGIGAILRTRPPGPDGSKAFDSIPDRWLDIIDDAILHRGPDGHGRFRDHFNAPDGTTLDVAIVHRRLSIIDLDAGAQPMVHTTPEGFHVAIAFNGCIYNHGVLRTELEDLGHVFNSDHSDTEVILLGWIAWGRAVFDRLNGMFAVVLWDGRDGTFVTARDAFGEKPLYGATNGGFTVVANVPKAVAGVLACFDSAPDAHSIEAKSVQAATVLYFGAVPWTNSFRGIEQTQPGGVYDNAPLPNSAFRPRFAGLHQSVSFSAAMIRVRRETSPTSSIDEIETAIGESVHARLDADVPVAALLSGGVDSSLVCAFAKQSKPEILTLCVAMPEASYDESDHARRVAEHLGLTHVVVHPSAKPAEDLVHLIEHLGHPFGDSSILPTYWACRAAREHAKVLLTGDGGDELFLGYDRYRIINSLRWLQVLRPVLSLVPQSTFDRSSPKNRSSRAARLLAAAKGRGYADLVAIFPITDLADLVSDRIARQAGTDRDKLSELFWDLFDHFPDVLLRKVDHAAMVAGVETRAPFLDRHLAGLVLPLPVSRLCPGGERKGLLRAIARKHLPADIVDRPKQGFAVPIGEWFRTDFGGLKGLLTDLLGSADPFPVAKLGCEVNLNYVKRIMGEHLDRRRDHSERLFMLLTTAIWCRATP